MKKQLIITPLIFAALSLVSCEKEKNETVEGYRPIYASGDDLSQVETRQDEPLQNPGRIYTYENYLLVNDQGKGIHIYDNSNVSQPTHVSFIDIPGNMDFSVSQDVIYADNITDLVLINIGDATKPSFVNRIEGVFPLQQFPDEFGAFECADPTKGIVVGWEKTTLTNPGCYR